LDEDGVLSKGYSFTLDTGLGREYRLPMIQAIYKGIEIEMELHQKAHDNWKCDYTLIKHPRRTETIHHGDKEFPTMDLAKAHALQEARDAIDRGAP
jgi:hypothetical protein